MFRWLAVVVVLCVGTFLLMNMALHEKGWDWFSNKTGDNSTNSSDGPHLAGTANWQESIKESNRSGVQNQLVVHEARVQAVDKQEVACEKGGVLLFVGTEMTEAEIAAVPPEQRARNFREGRWIPGVLGALTLEVSQASQFSPRELFSFPDSPRKKYRLRKMVRINPNDPDSDVWEPVTPGGVRVGLVPRIFRKLEVGEWVKRDQLLAVIDPKLALDELEIKVSKLDSAAADRMASEKTRDEAKKRLEAIEATLRVVSRGVSEDDRRVPN